MRLVFVLAIAWLFACVLPAAGQSPVRAWEEPLVIPTYQIGPPAADPMFYTGRNYQGAKGKIYPYPLYDTLLDQRTEQSYHAVYMENKYVKICVLPERGGRILSALDKTNNYDYVYRQTEIKPALIGMLGAWISGGVEWDLPHHHRSSTYNRVDYRSVQNPDGSSTVWLGEIELRHRLKWLVGLTLYPDKSYLAVTTKLLNRTPLAHSFLSFTNLAVHANPDYQVIFPPDTQFATQHGKVEFVRWPISHEFYGGVDHSQGVDISWWKNHPSPVSFFAWGFTGDFFGGYDHGRKAGTIGVQDHNVSPGAKFFEWGNGPDGEMWDKLLDSAGPYLELMAGNYSDNQPDYSWDQPYETRAATQYWFPIRDLGGAKNANLNGAVNLEVDAAGKARFGFSATQEFTGAKVLLQAGNRTLFEVTLSIAPDRPFVKEMALPAGVKEEDLKATLLSAANKELLSYQPVPAKDTSLPKPMTPPGPPQEFRTVEELYLAGLRLEQFHNPSLEAYPYFEEALRRDPGNYLVNTTLGRMYCERGLWDKAEQHLNTAIARITHNYTRPKDGEAYYYLGVALRGQEKGAAAEDAFQRAAWSLGWTAASFYQLAELAGQKADWSKTLDYLERSLATNTQNARALNLKAAILRHLGQNRAAEQSAEQALVLDPLDLWAAHEVSLARAGGATEEPPRFALGDAVQSNLELALDYYNAGLLDEAAAVLNQIVIDTPNPNKVNALAYYYLGYLAEKKQQPEEATTYYQRASQVPIDYVFPFRLETERVLRSALRANPRDAHALYYLGNLLFDLQPEAAIKWWEKSAALDGSLAVVHRNLALAYDLTENDTTKAIASMEKALALNQKNPLYYYELDRLYETGNVPPEKRLAAMEGNPAVVAQRSDSLSQQIEILILLGRYDQAVGLLGAHNFHNWEGQSSIHDIYMDALLLRGQQNFTSGKYREALKDYNASLEYPPNLGVGQPYRQGRLLEVYWLKGVAYEALGDKTKAKEMFQQAAPEPDSPRERQPEMAYYQGLACQKLGRTGEANRLFAELIATGENGLTRGQGGDTTPRPGRRFLASEPVANAHYLIGLGKLGQGNAAQAGEEFKEALKLNVNHLGARTKLAALVVEAH